MVELRLQLDRERRLRMTLEDQTRALESQLYPEKIREIAQSVQFQYHTVVRHLRLDFAPFIWTQF